MSKIFERLTSAEDLIKKLQDDLSFIRNNQHKSSEGDSKNNSQSVNNASSSVSDK